MDDFTKAFQIAQERFDVSEAAVHDNFERLKRQHLDSEPPVPCTRATTKDETRVPTNYMQLRKARRNENQCQPLTGHSQLNFATLRILARERNLSFLDHVENHSFAANIVMEPRWDAISAALRLHSAAEDSTRLVLWVDGSVASMRTKRSSSGAGVAVVWNALGDQDLWTHPISEAFEMAWAAAEKASCHFREVHIFSDALGVLASLTHLANKSFTRRQLAKDVALGILVTRSQCLMQRGLNVHLHWVPARSNIVGNKKADKVARRAARDSAWCLKQWQRLSNELNRDLTRARTMATVKKTDRRV